MRLLLDTHVVLWQLSGVRSLGERAREEIAAAGELAFSVVSFAEIGVKAAVGKLTVPHDLHAHVVDTGLRVLSLSAEHGLAAAGLPADLLRPPPHGRAPGWHAGLEVARRSAADEEPTAWHLGADRAAA